MEHAEGLSQKLFNCCLDNNVVSVCHSQNSHYFDASSHQTGESYNIMSDENKSNESSEMDVDANSGSNEPQFASAELSSKAAATATHEDQPAQENSTNNSAGSENEQMIIDDMETVSTPAAAAVTATEDPVKEAAVESPANGAVSIHVHTETSSEVIDTNAEDRKRASSPSNNVPSKKSRTELSMPEQDVKATDELEPNSNSTQDERLQNKPMSTPNNAPSTTDLPAPDAPSDQAETGYECLESSIANLIEDKLEPINEVTPLQPLSLRDLGAFHAFSYYCRHVISTIRVHF